MSHGSETRAVLHLMVGLPASGKTTRARELAREHRALLLSPDEWMIPLFGRTEDAGKRDAVEGRLIALALQGIAIGTSVILDFGLWTRDERSSLRWMARSAGGEARLTYLPIDHRVQWQRIRDRWAAEPETTFPISEEELSLWRAQFETPDEAELDGTAAYSAPEGASDWSDWAAWRWPSLNPGS